MVPAHTLVAVRKYASVSNSPRCPNGPNCPTRPAFTYVSIGGQCARQRAGGVLRRPRCPLRVFIRLRGSTAWLVPSPAPYMKPRRFAPLTGAGASAFPRTPLAAGGKERVSWLPPTFRFYGACGRIRKRLRPRGLHARPSVAQCPRTPRAFSCRFTAGAA